MKKRFFLILSAVLIVGLTFGMSYLRKASAIVPGTNYLASSDGSGGWANGASVIASPHSISGDGRYVVFVSSATNLVPGDVNGQGDVYVKDTQTGNITLIDVDSIGNEASNGADSPAISYDGRYVVFHSTSNLVSGTTGATIYRRDLVSGVTAVVSKTSSGTSLTGAEPDVNADGRYVAFINTSVATHFVMIKDMTRGTTQNVLAGSWNSEYPSIDCDGHIVVFASASNLGGGTPAGSDQTNSEYNYYYSVIDGATNPITYISNDSFFTTVSMQPPQISCNGNVIVYSNAHKYLHSYNRLTSTYGVINNPDNSTSSTYQLGSVSDDGRYIAFSSAGTNLDTSHLATSRDVQLDVFIRDTKSATTQLVSSTAAGYMSGRVAGNVSLSPDGSTIAYNYNSPDARHTAWEMIAGVDTANFDVYSSKTGF